jgi:uncharacterized membrane protein
MRLTRALQLAAVDLYHQAWRLIILNVLLGAAIVAVVFATLAVRPAIVLAVLIGPVIAAVMHCAVTLAQTEDLRLREVVVGLRRYWRRGLALGVAVLVAALLGAFALPFYAHAGHFGWVFVALCVYVLLAFALVQLLLWPLAVFESSEPLPELARDALRAIARRPGASLGLGVALLLINVLGFAAAILPFLTLTIAYSFLVSAHFALPKSPLREV